jgi:hypothetical protein
VVLFVIAKAVRPSVVDAALGRLSGVGLGSVGVLRAVAAGGYGAAMLTTDERLALMERLLLLAFRHADAVVIDDAAREAAKAGAGDLAASLRNIAEGRTGSF